MKLFGYVLIACVVLLTAVLGIPAFQMGKYLLAAGIIAASIFLCLWIYAIYGPLNASYTQAKTDIIGLIARPVGQLVIVCCFIFSRIGL